jgi:hypothetical protein
MFDPTTLTGFHTWLSLVAIAAGLLMAPGLIAGRAAPGLAEVFLATTALTSITGFLFPYAGFLPSHAVGVAALLLAPVLAARFAFGQEGAWARVYRVGLVGSLYFLLFVALAQAFMKVPGLRELGPGAAGPAFAIAQAVLLAAAMALGVLAARRTRPGGIGDPGLQ